MKNILRIGLLIFILVQAGAANAQLFRFAALFEKSDAEKVADAGVWADRQIEYAQASALANFLLRAAGPVCVHPARWRAIPAFSGLSSGPNSKGAENPSRLFVLHKFLPKPSATLVVVAPHRWDGLDAAGLNVGDVILPPAKSVLDELDRAFDVERVASVEQRLLRLNNDPIEVVASVVRGSSTLTVPLLSERRCADFEVAKGEGHWAVSEYFAGMQATGPLLKKLSRVEQAAVFAHEIGLLMIHPAPSATIGQPAGLAALFWNREAQMMHVGVTWPLLFADVYAIKMLSHLGVSAAEYANTVTRLHGREFGSSWDASKYSITRRLDRTRIEFLEDVVRAEAAGEAMPSADEAAQKAPGSPLPGIYKPVQISAIQAAFARPAIAKWLPEVREWLRKP